MSNPDNNPVTHLEEASYEVDDLQPSLKKASNSKPKANKPKQKNNPPSTQKATPAASLPWARSMPMPPDVKSDFTKVAQPKPIGFIDLKMSLPTTIAKPFTDVLTAISFKTVSDRSLISDCNQKLISLSYYKAARQLYHTLSPAFQNDLYKLKPVCTDTTSIPRHMSAALAMIGNFDSKLGKIEVKHATTVFRRWVCYGLAIDPDIATIEPDFFSKVQTIDPDNLLKLIWFDLDGFSLLHEKIDELSDILHEPYDVTEDDRTITIQTQRLTRSNATNFSSLVPQEDPNYRKLVCLSVLKDMPKTYWLEKSIPRKITFPSDNTAPTLPTPRYVRFKDATDADKSFFAEILSWMYLHTTGVDFDDKSTCNMFNSQLHEYRSTYQETIETHLKVQPAPQGDCGFPAQIVKSYRNTAFWKLPLSDSDAALGFMFNPNESFELAPDFRSHSRTTDKIKRHAFSSTRIKDNI